MDGALEYDAIVQTHWKFLYEDWPIIDRVKHHRTEIAAVNDIGSIKTFVLNRLRIIPVFFFLTVIFGTRAFSCPSRNVEKGVMILYVLVKGISLSDMAQYIPKTSFHTIHKEFYMHNPAALIRLLSSMLSEMFPTLKSRHLAAERSPDLFKNVTLNLDGHDSRITYMNADKKALYSYKLKKSGFRVQVCAELLDSADELQYENFCYPIQSYFGEMQSTFTKFSHTVVNKEYPTGPHHTLWLLDGFEYPSKTDQESVYTLPNIIVKMSQSKELLATRKTFGTTVYPHTQADDDMISGDDGRENEVEKIVGHRGEGIAREYHIIQKSSGLSVATWVSAYNVSGERVVEYLKSI